MLNNFNIHVYHHIIPPFIKHAKKQKNLSTFYREIFICLKLHDSFYASSPPPIISSATLFGTSA